MWSIAGVITRQLEQARSFEVTFWRSFFTVLSLLVILPFFQGRAVFAKIRSGAGRCGCRACAGASCSPPSWWR
jgi:flagellar biosynthesis protein FliR